ncbi:MAG: hypothetical protein ABEI74_01535 [Candidatus Pacearchaeota archaeon]
MLSDISDEERTLVLLELTRRLVLYSSPETYLKKLEEERKQEKNQSEEELYVPDPDEKDSSQAENKNEETEKKNQKLDRNSLKEIDREAAPKKPSPKQGQRGNRPSPQQTQQQKKEVLNAPEPKLPAQFSHLKPDNKNIDLDLGKLNPLLKDSAVKVIECHGPNQKVTVKGKMGEKPTNIQLSQEEIDEIIYTFSDKAGIPVEQGNTQMILGKFQMTVIKPEGEGNKRFIIKKMPPKKPQGPQGNAMPKSPGPKKSPSSLMPGSSSGQDNSNKGSGNLMPPK